jgi:hypothetical protein
MTTHTQHYTLANFADFYFDHSNITILSEATKKILADLEKEIQPFIVQDAPEQTERRSSTDRRPPPSSSSSSNSSRRPQQSNGRNNGGHAKGGSMQENWNAGKSFNVTKMASKEGIEKQINDLRALLNKLAPPLGDALLKSAEKEYQDACNLTEETDPNPFSKSKSKRERTEEQEKLAHLKKERDTIAEKIRTSTEKYDKSVQDFITMVEATIRDIGAAQEGDETLTEEQRENIAKIGQSIFDIASTNKFYSEMYAKLYKELCERFAVFTTILQGFIGSYIENTNHIQYVDGDKDYDGFCAYTKANDRRRAAAAFIINMMKLEVLPSKEVMNIITQMQQLQLQYIDEENRLNEVEEITETVFIFVTLCKSEIQKGTMDESWTAAVYPNIVTMSRMKAKEHKSMSSRVAFKYMDIMDFLKK